MKQKDSNNRTRTADSRRSVTGRLLFLSLLLFTFLGGARATEVTIGDLEGAGNNSFLPMNSMYNYSYSQQIYTAEEIGMAGTINSITVWLYGNANLLEMPFDIYMVETDKDAFSGNTDWVTVTADDIVYSGSVTVHNTEAEAFTFELDTPFTYSGQGNLLIAFNNTTGNWKSGLNGKVFTTEDNVIRSIYARQDTGAYDPTNPTFTAFGTTNHRNVIEIDITAGSGSTCEKPETMEVSDIGTNSAVLTWTGGSGNYNVEYKLASETDWTPVLSNTTATTTTLPSLTPATAYQARVQSVCSGDATSGWKSVNFTTDCGAITTFPWSEDFENYASGNFVGLCWVNEHIEGTGTYLFRVSTSSLGGNSTHQLQLPDMPGGTLTKLVLPEMNLPANYEFSIDIYRSSNTYQSNPYELEGIRVYASTDGEIEGATELAFIPRHFEVSNDVIPAESAAGWYTYELPIGMSGTCYIILRGESQYCSATFMDNLAVKPVPSCPKPTGFAVVSNSVTAHEATVTWTENGEATNWELAYSYMEGEETMEQHIPITQNPYTITGLIPEMHYFNVCVRAKCGEDDNSEWSNMTDFTTTIACPAPTGLAANPGNYTAALNWNGTSDSYIVSYRTAVYAEGIVEEFNKSGLPAGWTRYSGLVDDVLAGEATLTSVNSFWNTTNIALGQYNMKLNIYGSSAKYWLVTPEFKPSQDLSFDLALTKYNSADPIADDTQQADDRFIVLIYADDAWTILREWNNSGSEDVYNYNAISATGENVTIDLSAYYGQDVKIAFYGESTSSTGYNAGDNDLHIDNVICGIPYAAGEWQTVPVNETTTTITGLNPLTAYEAKVQGDCGELDGQSLETNVITFTTLGSCPVPQNVEAEDITHNSATVSWEGYTDSYSVSYRTAAYVDGVIEHFDVSGVPSGWTRYTGLVDDVVAGTTELTTYNGGWQTTSYALGQYNMKVNIYGTYSKYWLVTPEFKPSQDLSFDLALTKYNSADPIQDETLQADDRFVVLIYADDAWHILREWNNNSSEYIYNNISYEGENVTINLSAYYGKRVKIAFYGESTNLQDMENTDGDNDLHIDNVICGIPYDAGEWQTASSTSNSVTLTGLTPETLYEVRVKSDCSDPEEWSEVATFTTMPSIELANNADNSIVISNYDGNEVEVTLANRILYRDDAWNTLTLPFNVDITADGCPLAGADARELVGAEYDGTTLQLSFTAEENPVTSLVAGTPYIIKWAESATNIENPVFSNVTIDKTVNNKTIDLGEGRSITFTGTYNLLSFTTEDKSILFLSSDGKANTLYWPQANASIGAQRAYFKLIGFDETEGVRFMLNFGNGSEATGIVSAKVSGDARDSWYTVDGVKLNGAPKRKGIYIHNGVKVVIK